MGTSTERVFGIIVAAGSGERLGASLPKALVPVGGPFSRELSRDFLGAPHDLMSWW